MVRGRKRAKKSSTNTSNAASNAASSDQPRVETAPPAAVDPNKPPTPWAKSRDVTEGQLTANK